MANSFGNFLQGYNTGSAIGIRNQEQRQQRTLADLLGRARGATGQEREGLLAQSYGVNPQAAMQAEQQFAQLDDMKAEQLGRMATVFVGMTPEQRAQTWPSLVPQLQQVFPGAPFDAQWDEANLPLAQSMAQQLGGGTGIPAGYQEFSMLARDANLSPADRALAARRALYLDPRPSNAAIKYEGIEGGDGRTRMFALDPNNPSATQIGGQQPQQFMGAGGVPVQIGSDLPPQVREEIMRLERSGQGVPTTLGGVDPLTSRRPEDEAFAEELARGRAGLQLAPAQADAEAARTRKVEEAKAGVEREANAPKRTAKAQFEIDRATRVEAAVDRALSQADWNATGLVGGVLSGVPSTDAFNLARTIDEIKANIGFKEIQTMRDNSPTGGALGQVAIQELQMLQATLGSLDQAQTGEQLRATLQRVKDSMARWRQLQEAIVQEANGREAAPADDVDSLLDLYR